MDFQHTRTINTELKAVKETERTEKNKPEAQREFLY